MTEQATGPARALWQVTEPLHALTYFAPECLGAFENAGLRGFWRGYFAGRAAPLGAVGAGLVTAVFYGFHRDFVARAVPDVWDRCRPQQVLEARWAGVDAAIRAHLDLDEVVAVAATVRPVLAKAAAVADLPGRPMFAANRDLDEPEEPHLALWHAGTLLREHRGDAHVTALVAAEGTAARPTSCGWPAPANRLSRCGPTAAGASRTGWPPPRG